MPKHIPIIALAGLLAAPALAQDPPAQPAKPVKEKKICRAGGETGSRMVRRQCKTQAEWDMVDDQVAVQHDALPQGAGAR